jgi:UDP-N-acetylglucosamine--N-acetylmuramyl-(pentapeptide) pyrophosphoryl-undecaprenol N-acetylglucosamine transferase
LKRNRLCLLLHHLFPGLAVAAELAEQMPHVQLTFAGSGRALEQKQVAAAGYPYVTIPCRPAPRRAWEAVRFLSDNFAGLLAAKWYLRERKVSLVVGLGSYASVPMARAAIAQGIPLVLLEANAIPGRATRFLAASASAVCTPFESIAACFKPNVRIRVTGLPVRQSFVTVANRPRPEGPWSAKRQKQLLILGGSNGSTSLNESLPRAIYKLGTEINAWQIVHQTGAGQVQQTQELYQKLGLSALVVSFIDNMPSILRETDLVVCRAGGSTLAELSHFAPAAVVVPLPDSTDDHQRHNAQLFATAGACRMIDRTNPEDRLDDRLVRVLSSLINDEAERNQLSRRLATFAQPNAAADVAATIGELLPHVALRMAA